MQDCPYIPQGQLALQLYLSVAMESEVGIRVLRSRCVMVVVAAPSRIVNLEAA